MKENNEEDIRNHRVKSDYGNFDYFKHYKRDSDGKHTVNRGTFSDILMEFNSHVRDRISKKGAEYIMPRRIGKIQLRKLKTEIKIDDDGKIINELPTNWKATKELWAENKKAKENKIRIRYTNEHTGGYTFRIFYKKYKANYKNKSIYKMQFNRDMKRELSKSIFAGKIDAFLR